MQTATTGSPWLDFFSAVWTVLLPFIAPAVVALLLAGLAEAKRRGYQVTYATAIARALGAGVDAATSQGLDPFKGEGRSVAINAGIGYLKANVNDAAKAIGIVTDAQHADRITAEMGSVKGKAIADAQAMLQVGGPTSIMMKATDLNPTDLSILGSH